MDMLWLLIKTGTDINALSQHRCIAASNINIILGIADVFKYFIELRARTLFIIKVLARMYHLREN
jgi:hypothetical protein